MKKLLILLLALVISISVCTTVYASGATVDNGSLNIRTVDIDDVPDGIVPLELTEAEYLKFIDEHSEKIVINDNYLINTNARISSPESYTTSRTFANGMTVMNLRTNYIKYDKSPTAPIPCDGWTITSASCVGYLSNLTIGMEVREQSASSLIFNNNKSVRSNFFGVMDFYFLITGGIKLISQPFEISHTVNLA